MSHIWTAYWLFFWLLFVPGSGITGFVIWARITYLRSYPVARRNELGKY